MPKGSQPSSLLRKPREARLHGAVSYGLCPKVSTSLAGVGRGGASGSAPSSRFRPLSVVLSAAKAFDSILTRTHLLGMARCGLAARFRRYRCSARVPFPPARMEATRRRRPSPNKAGRSSHRSKSAGSAAQTEEASGGARAEYWAAMSGVPVILCGWCHAAHCHVVPDRKKVIGRDLLDGAGMPKSLVVGPRNSLFRLNTPVTYASRTAGSASTLRRRAAMAHFPLS